MYYPLEHLGLGLGLGLFQGFQGGKGMGWDQRMTWVSLFGTDNEKTTGLKLSLVCLFISPLLIYYTCNSIVIFVYCKHCCQLLSEPNLYGHARKL